MAGAVFTPGQLQFVSRYAAQTGLNPQVVAAQVFNEMNGSAAASRQAAGDHDWLNIGRTDSGPRGAGDPVWNNPITAADASANWIKGTYSVPGFGKAASGITAILKSVGQGPAAQIQALQQSPWASSHYPNLPAVFQTVSGTKLPAASGVPASPMLPSAGLSLPAPPSPQRTMQSAQPNIVGALLGSLGQGPDALLRSLVNANVQAATQPQASPSLPSPPELPLGGNPVPTSTPVPTLPSGDFKAGDPVPVNLLSSIGGEHDTAGLAGYPAHDYMAKAGTPVVAPTGGTIVRFSGHDPRDGPVSGVHGPFGWSLYLQGNDGRTYYMTHLGSRDVKVGQKVQPGAMLGTVGDYAKWGGADHVHMGVHTP